MNVPITIMATAGVGGAWGIALLAAFSRNKLPEQALSTFLNQDVFDKVKRTTITPIARDVKGFESFMTRYQSGLPVELSAIDHL